MIIPSNSYGERLLEQYGNKVTVSAEITKIKINYKGGFADFNDPLGFNTGEVAVLYSFSEPGHKNILETELNLSGWDLQIHDSVPTSSYSRYKESINKEFADQTKYVHIECHPTGTMNAVFTVYNVNGRWPDWEGILKDTAVAAGFGTLRQLAIEVGLVAGEGATMGGLFVAAALSVAVQNIIYTIRGNESLGVGTTEIDLQELGDNGEQTYSVTTAETQFGNAEIEFIVRTHTEDIPCSEVASSNTSLQSNEFYAMLDNEFTSPEIPDWVRQNAMWWSEGATTDREFANAVGFLVKEDLIMVSVPLNTDGTIMVDENLVIPGWIRNNAKWWAENKISDNDFKQGIQHMINENIISFNSPITSIHNNYAMNNSEVLDTDVISDYYLASRWQEFGSFVLLEIKNYEESEFGRLTDDAWEYYSEDKDPILMEKAQTLEQEKKNAQGQTATALQIHNSIKTQTKEIKDYAKKIGVSPTVLENNSKVVQEKQDSLLQINSDNTLDNSYKIARDAFRESADIKNIIHILDGQSVSDIVEPDFVVQAINMLDEGTPLKDFTSALPSQKVSILSKQASFAEVEGADLCDGDSSDYILLANIVLDDTNDLRTVDYELIGPVSGVGYATSHLGEISIRVGGLVPGKYTLYAFYDSPFGKTSIAEIFVTIPEPTCTNNSQTVEKTVTALLIGGKYYPVVQFVSAHPDNCKSYHYHSPFASVRSIDGVFISDPDKNNCGFGTVDSVPVKQVPMTQQEIGSFKNETGLEP